MSGRDWTGEVFGWTVVLGLAKPGSHHVAATWTLKCVCGSPFERSTTVLANARTRGAPVLCNACISTKRRASRRLGRGPFQRRREVSA